MGGHWGDASIRSRKRTCVPGRNPAIMTENGPDFALRGRDLRGVRKAVRAAIGLIPEGEITFRSSR